MKRMLIRNGTVVTLGASNRVLPNHSVLVEEDTIRKVGPDSELGKEKTDTTIDAKGKVVLPGFINAHTHFYSAFSRGLGKAKLSKNFVEVLENLWWRLDKKLTADDNYYSALLTAIDAIRHGTTTGIDHHASPFAITGSLSKIADAVAETGIRACLCYELSDRDGPEKAAEGIQENVEFLKRKPTDRLTGLFGLHAQFTIGDKTLERAVEASRGLNAGFHVHTAEAASDQEQCEKTHKMRVVERLKKFGILGKKTICAHGVHLNDREMDLLAESDTILVHNPQSNMNNAVGVADLLKMVQKKILVGLGTDAMTENMLEEARCALWVLHLSKKEPSVGFMEVLNALLSNNAKIAQRLFPAKIGEIREGYKADFALFDYDPPTEFSDQTFLGHLLFGLSQVACDTTIVGGKVLMQGKKLIGIDEPRISARARELSTALWARF
ncbi:MAG: putative aminohydrolase SsnA [Pseudomonadota bacterium]